MILTSYKRFLLLTATGLVFTGACQKRDLSSVLNEEGQSIEPLIAADRLAKIKNALPSVSYPKLQSILNSDHTLWYDHESLPRAYQDSYGADFNRNWPNQVAASAAAAQLFDHQKRRWRFPFATTAGADNSTNIAVANFLHLPVVDGKTLPIPQWTARRNFGRNSWQWMYPNGTIVGEIIFIRDGDGFLPSEVRIRTRYMEGWAVNVYRPFVNANQLAQAIKQRRPTWQQNSSLTNLVAHLENDATLIEKNLVGDGGFRNSFQQRGALDVLPDFGDDTLVRELLRETTFISSYGQTWKSNGNSKTFTASTRSNLSVVPNNFEAGVIEVSEESCNRCHREAGNLASDYQPALALYGELWGKDNIFSFYVFDPRTFRMNRNTAFGDTRRQNPDLVKRGVVVEFNSEVHKPPHYRPFTRIVK